MKSSRVCFLISTIVLLFVGGVVFAQTQPGGGSQTAQSGSTGNMSQMMRSNPAGGMMGGCPSMSGGTCPMMGGMGMGAMMAMMVLTDLFLIAAIFALFTLGLFLLRRSRPPVTQ